MKHGLAKKNVYLDTDIALGHVLSSVVLVAAPFKPNTCLNHACLTLTLS